MDFEILFSMLESAVSSTEAVSVQAEFFRKLYADASLRALPFVNAFLIVSGWLGTSLRSGVWTFYEATPQQDVQAAAGYLEQSGFAELAAMLQKGIHDYQAPQYQADFDYPEEWITESEEIDRWITAHEDAILHHLTDELLRRRQELTEAIR